MAGSKRERELARAKFERQQARRAAEAAKRRRRNTIVAAVAGLVVVGLGVAWFLRPSSGSSSASGATPTPAPSGSSTASVAGCTPPPATRTNDLSWKTAPAMTIDRSPTARYDIDFTTNCGVITIQADNVKAPQTTNSMVFLTNEKYFDATSCHRLTTQGIYVLQCGDPTGSGTGGPGYSIPDENLPKAGTGNYPAGTVAMANSGANTNGSQFFLVYKTTTLPASYTIWGKVTEGLDVVTKVAAAGVEGGGGDGAPAQPISIVTGQVSQSQAAG